MNEEYFTECPSCGSPMEEELIFSDNQVIEYHFCSTCFSQSKSVHINNNYQKSIIPAQSIELDHEPVLAF